MKYLLRILPALILPAVAVYMLARLLAWEIVAGYLVLISILTTSALWYDKFCAQNNRWRIPERSLHLFELLGGWPAAYFAQQALRHKTSKRSYRIVFWAIVALYQFLAFELITGWRLSQAILSLFG